MKKILLFVSFLAIGLTSCSKDDDSSSDGGSTPAAIEGKWAFSKEGAIVGGNETLFDYAHECATKKDYVELVAGGVANDVYYPSDSVAETTTGTWSLYFIHSLNHFGISRVEKIRNGIKRGPKATSIDKRIKMK